MATAGGCEAGTGPPRCSQPLIASRRPALPPHLHPIYSLEPAQPRGMAAVGTVAGATLPPAEGGTRGPAPHAAGGAAGSSDGQAPRSWLRHRQGTAALPWGTWLAGGSMPCAASASPEGTGARPGAGSQRAPARRGAARRGPGREKQDWAAPAAAGQGHGAGNTPASACSLGTRAILQQPTLAFGWLWPHSQAPAPLPSWLGVPMGAGDP